MNNQTEKQINRELVEAIHYCNDEAGNCIDRANQILRLYKSKFYNGEKLPIFLIKQAC